MIKNFKSKTVILALVLGAQLSAHAQDIAKIGKEKALSVSGGIALNQIFYGARGTTMRRDPYTAYASGNINVSLYGWSIPVSFSVTNKSATFQQPFNQYSIHPTYKWITAHVGYTSVSYSPYTVNGHLFLGGAVDVTPENGKWKFGGLHGRFMKAIEPDTLNEQLHNPSFKRMGTGFKASYLKGKDYINIIMFHAKDDVNSISYVPQDENILPEENFVTSLGVGKSFLKNFLTRFEIASSALSRDTRSERAEHENVLAKSGLFAARTSSSYYKAMKGSIDYQAGNYTVGLMYERIDPQYRTLGSYYFNNDLENITANAATTMLNGKINLSANVGTQHDNLDHSKISTMRRLIGSFNVGYTASEKLNFSAAYSNFQTYTNIRSQFVNINQLTPLDNLDTLTYTQISQNASFAMIYVFGKNPERKQNVNINITYQDSHDTQGDVEQNTGMEFYNFNTAYSLNFVPSSTMISIAFNGNLNSRVGFNSTTMGPTVSLSKLFLDKKIRSSLSSSYNTAYTNGQKMNAIFNVRLSGSYTIRKKHNLNIGAVMMDRSNKTATSSQTVMEFTGTLGYSYSFSY